MGLRKLNDQKMKLKWQYEARRKQCVKEMSRRNEKKRKKKM
jgi:hypothetical protein